MEEAVNSPFLQTWHQVMIIGAFVMLLAGIALYIIHQVRVASIQDYKAKYDFINTRESRNYKGVFLCFGLAVALAINLYGMGENLNMGLWFFIRLFISVAGGTLVVYVAYLVLEYYYPTVLNRKLRKWRYKPRVSSSGNEMRLLSEDEEDVHLEEGMRAEEDVFSIDYDVWLDEKTGEIKIEKYPGHLQALQCNSCGFFTMRVIREEITRQPSHDTPGELIKHYQCQYCKAVRATAFNISTKEASDYRNDINKPRVVKDKDKDSVDAIRIEIHSAVSGKKFYEFQNLEQAMRFLEGYESGK
jgi:hypothetical protein